MSAAQDAFAATKIVHLSDLVPPQAPKTRRPRRPRRPPERLNGSSLDRLNDM
jgi:hypothetical protein